MREALMYQPLYGDKVACGLCSHRCTISEGRPGICRVRVNHKGKLYSLVYGKIVAENIDPIEKKPLYHFLSGTRTYSIGTVGCNLVCAHCQNVEISQARALDTSQVPGRDRTPAEVVEQARAAECESIAYTYNEPTMFYEFARDTALLAGEQGLQNVWVTNGFMSAETAHDLSRYVDAANVDLKAFDDDFYKKVCGARLAPVLDNIKTLYNNGVWVELTTLIIPGENDDEKKLAKLARFIRDLSPEVPWHISRFFPAHKMGDKPPTDVEFLKKARDIGRAQGLKNVHLGNVAE